MNRWKVILAAAVIFLAGAASGACGLYLYKASCPPQANRTAANARQSPVAGPRVEFLRRASLRLDLTPEQHEKVDAMLSESQQRLRKLWEPVAPQARAEVEALRKNIEEILTSEQKGRFAKLLSERAASQGGPGDNGRRKERGERPDPLPGSTNSGPKAGTNPSSSR